MLGYNQNMKFIFKYWVWLIAIISVILFLWLRFYSLRTAFDFTGDPGRDMLTLWDWRENGKPPLLGPQTSAMPLNQSAVYFYMLYPVFLLMNGNPISANITVAIFWIVSLVAGLVILRKRPDLQWVCLIVFALSSIQPIFVSQTRAVWNPSFLPPLITAVFISILLLEEKFSLARMFVFTVSLAWAVSLHFPIGTIAVAGLFYVLFFFKKNRFLIALSFIFCLYLFNLPTLIFEIRHDFLISKSVLSGNWLGVAQYTRWENIKLMIGFTGSLGLWWANLAMLFGLGIFGLTKIKSKNVSLTKIVGFVFFVSLLLTIASKMAFHSHYIFGFVIALFILISQLPTKIFLPLFLVLEIIWLNPTQTNRYFTPARRTFEEMSSCMSKICSSEKTPVFVSVQSALNPFHVGYEYRYMMKQSGCQVKYIESQPDAARTMVVILDDSSYEPGETGFNELTLFGKSKVVSRYVCSKNFGAIVLQKI